MLSIRLSRVGKKKAPVYRIVVMPKQQDPWAPSLEILGHYNPRKTPKEFVVNAERVTHWISQGAQATDSVWNLLVENKVVEGEKRTATHISKKRAGKMEEKAVEAKAKAEEAAAKAKAKEEEAAAEAKAAAEAPVEEASVEEAPEAEVAETEAPEEATEEKPAEAVKE